MLWWSILAFKKFDPAIQIILVVNPDFIDRWEAMFGEEERSLGLDIIKVKGGRSRVESVKNGLKYISGHETENDDGRIVYIHDSARPFVSPELISRGAGIVESGKGVIPVVPLTDSIRKLVGGTSKAVDRNEYFAVQTPQIFLFEDIWDAYNSLEDETGMTDDASIAEHNGIEILTFEGDPENFKVTTASDLRRIGSLD